MSPCMSPVIRSSSLTANQPPTVGLDASHCYSPIATSSTLADSRFLTPDDVPSIVYLHYPLEPNDTT